MGLHGHSAGQGTERDPLLAGFDTTSSEVQAGSVVVLGVPFDENSSFMRGPVEGPATIREALHSDSTNLCAETGLDLGADDRWKELGDLSLFRGTEALGQVEIAVGSLLEKGARVVTLGGDHSISYPILRAHAEKHPEMEVLQLDAHPDLYDELNGNRYSHACPFARVMEEGLVRRLVQVGVRTATAHQREQAQRFGVEMIEMRDWRPERLPRFEGPLYVTLDLDCLDPAFAPGVSHHEPGGLSVRDVIGILQGLNVAPVGADIVELNPRNDPSGVTAMVGAKLLKEILGRMLA
jgi:agmatinase